MAVVRLDVVVVVEGVAVVTFGEGDSASFRFVEGDDVVAVVGLFVVVVDVDVVIEVVALLVVTLTVVAVDVDFPLT